MTKLLQALTMSSALMASSAATAGFDGSVPLLCASNTVIECDDGIECRVVPARSVNVPEFLKVDIPSKKISTLKAGAEQRSTAIERMEVIDHKIMLQGAEDGLEAARDGLAWSMAIIQDTGRMSLAAAGEEVGFVIFGACTPLGE